MKATALSALLVLVVLASCQSAPPPLAPDAPAQIYFQRAQTASDQGQYDEALSIYRSFLADRPQAPADNVFSARYEIALLLAKKGLKAEALADFTAILADYDDLDKSAGAPGWVKVLSQKKLQELKEQTAKPKP